MIIFLPSQYYIEPSYKLSFLGKLNDYLNLFDLGINYIILLYFKKNIFKLLFKRIIKYFNNFCILLIHICYLTVKFYL